jgi:hypothetical protein
MDLVRPLKFETSELGTELDILPHELDEREDGILANGLAIEDSSTEIYKSDSEITFKDTVNGTVKLSDLGGSGTDIKVKISSNDTTADFLENKLVGETNKITLSVLNEGGNEQIQISKGPKLAEKSFAAAMAIIF